MNKTERMLNRDRKRLERFRALEDKSDNKFVAMIFGTLGAILALAALIFEGSL